MKHEFAGNFLGFVNTKSCAGVSLRATAWQLFWQWQLFEDMFEDIAAVDAMDLRVMAAV